MKKIKKNQDPKPEKKTAKTSRRFPKPETLQDLNGRSNSPLNRKPLCERSKSLIKEHFLQRPLSPP